MQPTTHQLVESVSNIFKDEMEDTLHISCMYIYIYTADSSCKGIPNVPLSQISDKYVTRWWVLPKQVYQTGSYSLV